MARVDAILRRTNNIGQDQIEQAGDIEINKAAHIVTVKGEPIELSFKNLNCYHISYKIKELLYQERIFLIMYGIMIILEMQELLTPTLKTKK